MLKEEISMENNRRLPENLSEEEMNEGLLLEDQEPTKDLSQLDFEDKIIWGKDE